VYSYDVCVENKETLLIDVGARSNTVTKPGPAIREKESTRQGSAKTITILTRQLLSRFGKRRLNVLYPDGTSWKFTTIFDGNQMVGAAMDPSDRTLISQASFTPFDPIRDRFVSHEDNYSCLFSELCLGGSLFDVINGRTHVTAEHQKDECIVIRSPPEDGSYRNFEWNVKCDPRFGMMATEILTFRRNEVPFSHTVIDAFHEVDSNVWAPVHAVTEIFGVTGTYIGQKVKVVELSIDRTKSKWNVELPDDLFSVNIASGTRVYDSVRGSVYVTGADSVTLHINDIVNNAQNSLPLRVRDGKPARELVKGTGSHRFAILLIFNVAVLGLLVTVIFLKKKR
jgi:hypothetical protein